jgi:zinc D-Ala-D-Ala dipeptidase
VLNFREHFQIAKLLDVKRTSRLGLFMNRLAFVAIETIIPDILTDIRYATENNFVGKKLYPSSKCYLRKGVALKLAQVQKNLGKINLRLKIFDGYRPRSVQRIFWEILPDDRYVANPDIGSKHNRGAAVDVTLVNHLGEELAMPTPFDHFSEQAHSTCTDLPPEIISNRSLLHTYMQEGGFVPLPTEWWHFDDSDWEHYPIEDVSFEALALV